MTYEGHWISLVLEHRSAGSVPLIMETPVLRGKKKDLGGN